MAGLVPAIHVRVSVRKGVDARNKSGHDGGESGNELENALAMPDAPWWKSAVIYQIYPRSFQDTDNDGVGDLRGIMQRLPYLVELGVDAIWISPIFPSPMADFGYDVSSYLDIDPLFGTLADFDALVAPRTPAGSGSSWISFPTTLPINIPGLWKAAARAAIHAGTGTFGATQVPPAGSPTIGFLSSAARRGSSIPQQVNTTTTPFSGSSPT